MKQLLTKALAMGLVIVVAGAVQGAEGWGNLNPFAKRTSGPVRTRTSDSGWKMPSLWPKSASTRSPAIGPSTWQKMTNSTKSAMSKTADFLNPFNDANDLRTTERSPTGYNTELAQSSTRKQQPDAKQASWFGGGEADQPKRPQSVNDFLAQPKPE